MDSRQKFTLIHDNDRAFLTKLLSHFNGKDPKIEDIEVFLEKQSNEFCHNIDKRIFIDMKGNKFPVTAATILVLLGKTDAAHLLVQRFDADPLWIAFGMGLSGQKCPESKDINHTLIYEMGINLHQADRDYQPRHKDNASIRDKEIQLLNYTKGLTKIVSQETMREIFQQGYIAGGHRLTESKNGIDTAIERGAMDGRRMDILQDAWDQLVVDDKTPKELVALQRSKQNKLLTTIITDIGTDFTHRFGLSDRTFKKNNDEELLSLMESLADSLDVDGLQNQLTFRKELATAFSKKDNKKDFAFLLPEKCEQIHQEMKEHDISFKEARKKFIEFICPDPKLAWPILSGDNKEGLIQDIITMSYLIKQKSLPVPIHEKLADALQIMYEDLKNNLSPDIKLHEQYRTYLIDFLTRAFFRKIDGIDETAASLIEQRERHEKHKNRRKTVNYIFNGITGLLVTLGIILGITLSSIFTGGMLILGALAVFLVSKAYQQFTTPFTITPIDSASILLHEAKSEYEEHLKKDKQPKFRALQNSSSPKGDEIEMTEPKTIYQDPVKSVPAAVDIETNQNTGWFRRIWSQ